jgi:hypothetical protein
MLMTVDEDGKMLPVPCRVGQAVDVVAQAGKPKTITGFQTHNTPVGGQGVAPIPLGYVSPNGRFGAKGLELVGLSVPGRLRGHTEHIHAAWGGRGGVGFSRQCRVRQRCNHNIQTQRFTHSIIGASPVCKLSTVTWVFCLSQVLMSAGERAELATEKYIPLTPILEGLVILKKNPDFMEE